MTNEEYLEKYLAILRFGGAAPSTIRKEAQELKCFFRYLEAGLCKESLPADESLHKNEKVAELSQVSKEEIEGYQQYLYHYRTKEGNGLSVETQSRRLGMIRIFFKKLVRAGILNYNPAGEIDLPRARVRLPRDLLSLKEIRKILDAPDLKTVYGYRDRTMYEVLYSTGVRGNELANLKLGDVDLQSGYLRVIKGKGMKDRSVPLGEIAVGFLREYISHVRPYLVNNAVPCCEEILFLTSRGKRFWRCDITKRLSCYAKNIGIKNKVTARAFRVALATAMLRNHADIRQIQEILGHRYLSTTQIYLRIVKDDLKRVHQKTHPREQIVQTEEIGYKGSE